MFRKLLRYSPKQIIHKIFHKTYLYFFDFIFRIYSLHFSTFTSDDRFRNVIKGNPKGQEELVYLLRNGLRCEFFISRESKDFLTREIRIQFPSYERIAIKKADEICDHYFDLLGSGPTYLGYPINWHLDFISQMEYPPDKYYKDIKPAKYPGGHDIKVPWELSRCQHLAWLGQAYWFSGDEKYAEEFVDEVNDWIEKNPPRLGVNWVTAMDVAIRAVNWLW